MTWKKHFRQPTVMKNQSDTGGTGVSETSRFNSYLPEIYAGHPNRIQRYYQYDDMDRDSDVQAALTTIADFCTQTENDSPFEIIWQDTVGESEVKTIKVMMHKWCKLNNFRNKIWEIVRRTIKYGDCFFVKDPETLEWLWVDSYNVLFVKMDDKRGTKPQEYMVRDFRYSNMQIAAKPVDPAQYSSAGMVTGARPPTGMVSTPGPFQMAGAHADQRSRNTTGEISAIDASHMVHISLSSGMDANFPFGQSILDAVFKVYKQKEMLEDSIIIYRVQRAPERLVFYIDVGTMNPAKANAYVQKIKNDVHQRKIPARTGNGTSVMDAAYNPLAITDNYYFAQSNEGRGSKVDVLPGGDSLGEIGDLTFFSKKMARGFRIPKAYLNLGEGETGMAFSDGKIGTAMIEEFLFTKTCMRFQNRIVEEFDREFKEFAKKNGTNVPEDLYDIRFNPPQNFAKYRQIEVDTQQVAIYANVRDDKSLSKRYVQERYLGMTPDEQLKNEEYWAMENPGKIKKATGATAAEGQRNLDLAAVGIRDEPEADFTGFDDAEASAPTPQNFNAGGDAGQPAPDTGTPPGE